MLLKFGEIHYVYSENETKPLRTTCEKNAVPFFLNATSTHIHNLNVL
jgi:hypothetical protein